MKWFHSFLVAFLKQWIHVLAHPVFMKGIDAVQLYTKIVCYFKTKVCFDFLLKIEVVVFLQWT